MTSTTIADKNETPTDFTTSLYILSNTANTEDEDVSQHLQDIRETGYVTTDDVIVLIDKNNSGSIDTSDFCSDDNYFEDPAPHCQNYFNNIDSLSKAYEFWYPQFPELFSGWDDYTDALNHITYHASYRVTKLDEHFIDHLAKDITNPRADFTWEERINFYKNIYFKWVKNGLASTTYRRFTANHVNHLLDMAKLLARKAQDPAERNTIRRESLQELKNLYNLAANIHKAVEKTYVQFWQGTPEGQHPKNLHFSLGKFFALDSSMTDTQRVHQRLESRLELYAEFEAQTDALFTDSIDFIVQDYRSPFSLKYNALEQDKGRRSVVVSEDTRDFLRSELRSCYNAYNNQEFVYGVWSIDKTDWQDLIDQRKDFPNIQEADSMASAAKNLIEHGNEDDKTLGLNVLTQIALDLTVWPTLRLNISMYLVRLSQIDQAISIWFSLLEHNPSHPTLSAQCVDLWKSSLQEAQTEAAKNLYLQGYTSQLIYTQLSTHSQLYSAAFVEGLSKKLGKEATNSYFQRLFESTAPVKELSENSAQLESTDIAKAWASYDPSTALSFLERWGFKQLAENTLSTPKLRKFSKVFLECGLGFLSQEFKKHAER